MSLFRKAFRRFEQLEDRRLLAGDVQVFTSGGDLRIYGSDESDHVEVRLNSDGDVTVFGRNGTLVEGGSSFVAFEGGVVPDDVYAYLGDGDDSILLEGIEVGDDVLLRGQRGDDALGLYESNVGDDLRIYGESGRSSVSVDATTVGDDLAIYTSRGADTIGIDQSTVGDYTFVYAAGGDDRIIIRDSVHSGIANVVQGSGDNFLAIQGETVIEGWAFISSGWGSDNVFLQDAKFESSVFAFAGGNVDALENDGADFARRPFTFSYENDTIDVDGQTAEEAADAALLDLVASKARRGTIAELAILTPELSSLVGALVAADLVDPLNGTTDLTVFAPVNSAFPDPLPPVVTENLSSILLFHVTEGVIESSDVLAGLESTGELNVPMLNGEELVIPSITNLNNQGISLIIEGLDIRAKNGIIHLIDGVLLPPSLTS